MHQHLRREGYSAADDLARLRADAEPADECRGRRTDLPALPTIQRSFTTMPRDSIADFGFEPGVGGELEPLRAVGLQAEPAPQPGDGVVADRDLLVPAQPVRPPADWIRRWW
jgi:hypothetical protein